MNIAIVGATGNVGRKVLEVLELKKFPIDQLYLVASPKSVGKKISFNGKDCEVLNLETFDFTNIEITFFSAGGKISEQYAAKAAEHSTVIDNSSYFRMDPDVPLIVPEVNSHDLKNEKDEKIGELRSACYSPKFKKVIGIAMMQKQFWNNSQSFKIDINGDTFSGKVCDLPLS